MANVLDRVPLEQITAQAREIDPKQTILLIIAAILYSIGWVAGKAFNIVARALMLLFRALAWSGVAIKVGWTEARKPRQGVGPAR